MTFPLEQALNLQPPEVAPAAPLLEVISLTSQTSTHNHLPSVENDNPNLQSLEKEHTGCVLVVDDSQIVGILTQRDIVRLIAEHQFLAGLTAETVMTQPVITLQAEDDLTIFSALDLMRHHQIQHLPVVGEQGQVLGLLTPKRLRSLLQPADFMMLRQVHNAMNLTVIHARATDSVLRLTQMMDQHRVSYVVIVEPIEDLSESLSPMGIVTQRDIVQLQHQGLNLEQTQAQEVMSTPLLLVNPEDSLWSVHQRMQHHKVRRLVVADDQRHLQGIVTQSSLLPIESAELYEVLDLLQQEVSKLKSEKQELLEQRNQELEQLVQERTLKLQRREQVLRDLALVVTTETGEELLRSQVAHLTKTLQVDHVYVGQLVQRNSQAIIATLAALVEGQIIPNFEYALAGTPCESVITQQTYLHYRGVQDSFPDDQILQEYQIQEYIGTPLHNASSQVVGILVALSRQPIEDPDLAEEILTIYAERVSAELERQKADTEQHRFFSLSLDLFCIAGMDSYFKRLNPSFERILGYSTAELMAKPFLDFIHPEDRAASVREVEQLATGHVTVNFENRYRCRDGSYRCILWNAIPSLDQQEIYANGRDITEKKQLELQFLRAQRLESIGTLASGIAHDLNNILTPIYGVAQLLPMQLPHASEQIKHQFEILQNSTKRGIDIIQQVLSFSRGVEGELTPLNVKYLISELRNFLHKTFPKSLEMSVNLPDDLRSVKGDATQLYQMFLNLFINARDAMPEGGALSISATNLYLDQASATSYIEAQVGSYIQVTVADTGIGIPGEQQEHIFEPFFTTRQAQGGTGLGLSTVYNIIKGHGGFITVDSVVNQGTQFKVYLPAIETAESVEEEMPDLPSGQGELILIVDDEAPIREVAQNILEQHHYQVLMAEDGIDAIAQYSVHNMDIKVVVVDMQMPSLDGVTTLRIMQRINPQLIAIIASGSPVNEQITTSISENIKGFLQKPYSFEELLRSITNCLADQVTEHRYENSSKQKH